MTTEQARKFIEQTLGRPFPFGDVQVIPWLEAAIVGKFHDDREAVARQVQKGHRQ